MDILSKLRKGSDNGTPPVPGHSKGTRHGDLAACGRDLVILVLQFGTDDILCDALVALALVLQSFQKVRRREFLN